MDPIMLSPRTRTRAGATGTRGLFRTGTDFAVVSSIGASALLCLGATLYLPSHPDSPAAAPIHAYRERGSLGRGPPKTASGTFAANRMSGARVGRSRTSYRPQPLSSLSPLPSTSTPASSFALPKPRASAEPLPDFDRELLSFSHGMNADDPFDLLVVGCGPAGLGVADEAARRGLKVGVIDPNPLQRWPNNYGVWVDEFEQLGHDDCFLRSWKTAQVRIDETSSPIRLSREYAQVDRDKLKRKLLNRATDHGAEFLKGAVLDVEHDLEVSRVRVGEQEVHATQVLDATGHLRKLVEFESEFTPGYQAAYGATIEVDSHPYDLDSMMFMDWRDEHLDDRLRSSNEKLPTFLYVMPFSRNKIFVEETSLVARPFIPFDELKERLEQRLRGMGIHIRSIEEEEYCLIPMGGVLPRLPQRVLGIGGTAGMVHPATGYMVAKSLFQAPVLVDAIVEGMREDQIVDGADSEKKINATSMSNRVWNSIWPQEDRRQRTFMCFGMEILMNLDVHTTRRFFSTFFKLPTEMWGGFLSWRISSGGLIGVGLSIFQTASNKLRFEFVRSALPYLPTFVTNFATGGNEFKSEAWAEVMGIANELWRIPSIPSNFKTVGGLKGANPTSGPKSSSVDFLSLVRAKEQGNTPIGQGEADSNRSATAKNDNDNSLLETSTSSIGTGPPESLVRPLAAPELTDDREWIQFQQNKVFPDQPTLASSLPELAPGSEVDVLVAGVGPAGLALAGELAKRGVNVGLVGPDTPFTNNYGVWVDEFEELGLEHTLIDKYDNTLVVIDPKKGPEPVGRAYGRVGRAELRAELLKRCKTGPGKVEYYPGMVDRVVENKATGLSGIHVSDGTQIRAKMVTMSTGHNRDVLKYDEGDHPLWQTAYGIEINMTDHPWDPTKAVFMDLSQSDNDDSKDIVRVPSFLYVLPSKDSVFIEETCLISKIQVPFDELKRRLYRRLQNLNIEVPMESIIEEEASWIPLGGPLPEVPQPVLGFGAAAGLVHPASGYSIVNSLARAGPIAEKIIEGITNSDGHRADEAWSLMWSAEQRRKMAFYQFGAEMIAKMPLPLLQEFMRTFYKLPAPFWKGFLSHRLDSPMLIPFAISMFFVGNNELKRALIHQLASAEGLKMFKAAFAPVMNPRSTLDNANGSSNGIFIDSSNVDRVPLESGLTTEKRAQDEEAEIAIVAAGKESLQEPLKGAFRRGQVAMGPIPSGFVQRRKQ
mmetsp:Transcript_1612/g.3697  ORF Transcript_1612/g.3697 Transcript_1612/m.3697 type:complete len:1215 (-) Transcript_1612:111-3755(-)